MNVLNLDVHQVPCELQENYILSGYRHWGTGFATAFHSVFKLHNETFNIWSHALPLFYFLYYALLDNELWDSLDLPYSQRYPLYAYMTGICILFAVSSCAHWLNCVSDTWRNVFFMMDYSAISVYGAGAAIAYFFYSRPFQTPMLISCEYCFLASILGASVVATWTCCWTRANQSKVTDTVYVIRTCIYGIPFFVGSSPALMRILSAPPCKSYTDIIPYYPLNNTMGPLEEPHLHYEHLFRSRYLRHFILMVTAALFNMSKVPERWMPGVFDIIGQSHQWFHVFIFLSIREQFWCMIDDIQNRHDEEWFEQIYTPYSTVRTLVAHFILISSLVGIIAWFNNLWIKADTCGLNSSHNTTPTKIKNQ